VDAYTLLNFGVYASFITGNTTSAGVRAAQKQFATAGHSLLPIPFFILGVVAASLLEHADECRAPHRLSAIGGAMLLLDLAAVLAHGPQWLSISILSSAMGVVNTSVAKVGDQPVSLGFMTGNLNRLAKEVAKGMESQPERSPLGSRDAAWQHAGLLAALWVAFFSGSLLGAILAPQSSLWALMLPAVALLGFAVRERFGAWRI